jgi:hypothetical protein
LAKKKEVPIPARITPSEKQDVLQRLDRRIGQVAHRYAFQIKHGGTVEKKRRTNNEIKMLENERKSVNRMQPLPGHVKRAERD